MANLSIYIYVYNLFDVRALLDKTGPIYISSSSLPRITTVQSYKFDYMIKPVLCNGLILIKLHLNTIHYTSWSIMALRALLGKA